MITGMNTCGLPFCPDSLAAQSSTGLLARATAHLRAASGSILPAAIIVTFLLISLILSRKTPPGRKKTVIAGVLLSSIILWATINSAPLVLLSDRNEKVSPVVYASRRHNNLDEQIRRIRETCHWENEQIKKGACRVLATVPSTYFLKDLAGRLGKAADKAGEPPIDEERFYHLFRESFTATATASFDHQLTEHMRHYREELSLHEKQSDPLLSHRDSFFQRAAITDKITFIREHYHWKNDNAMHLSCYLLERFPLLLLSGSDFIEHLETKIAEKKDKLVDTTLLCQTMRECFRAAAEKAFTNLSERYSTHFRVTTLSRKE